VLCGVVTSERRRAALLLIRVVARGAQYRFLKRHISFRHNCIIEGAVFAPLDQVALAIVLRVPLHECSGDRRKITYQTAQDFRSPSRSDGRSIVGLCDGRRDAEGGRKDQRVGMGIDRNRPTAR